jgi:hypothetical protein
MKKGLALFCLSLFVVFTSVAQTEGLKYIDRNDLTSYMKFLASDELRGRETGREESDIAARYIASNLMRFGVGTIPGTDSYLQKIPFSSKTIVKSETVLTAAGENGASLVSSDSIISLIPQSASTEVSGKLVFAGYGFEDKATGYSDLKDLELADKIVMIMTRNPNISEDPKYADGYRFDQQVEVSKIMPLMGKKPKAILIVYDAKNKFHDAYTSGLADMLGGNSAVSLADTKSMTLPVKILFITGYTADRLLSESGSTLRQIQDRIDAGKKPASLELKNTTVSFRISMLSKNFDGYNVVGFIEGSDPVLKKECIVYSAHYDHLGVNGQGEVFNGADDNASGSVGLLGVADAFSHLKKKPLRSVIFVWVTGEEKGLLGSQYYVNHPVIEMSKTILDINLDMIGRSVTPADTGTFMGIKPDVTPKNEIILYSEHKSTQLMNIVKQASSKAGITIEDKGPNLEFGGSDHQSFSSKKVPFLFFHSGIHTDLHSVRDDAEKVDYEKMERVSKLVFMAGYSVANSKEGIKMDEPKK